jgi:hypothetical protein
MGEAESFRDVSLPTTFHLISGQRVTARPLSAKARFLNGQSRVQAVHLLVGRLTDRGDGYYKISVYT